MRMHSRILFSGLAFLFIGVLAPSFTFVQADTPTTPTGQVKYCQYSFRQTVELWENTVNTGAIEPSACSCRIDKWPTILVGQPESQNAGVCTTDNDCVIKCRQAHGTDCFTGTSANPPACAGTTPTISGCALTNEGRQSLSPGYLASFRANLNTPRCLVNPLEPPPPTAAGAGGSSATLYNPLGTNLIEQLIGRVIRALTGIVGALALLMFIVGGIMHITAGDSDRVKTAKDLIMNSLFGLVIILFAYTLVSVFLSIFGLNG
ncbi:MAG: hypothetical protein HY984_00470 [Candidatus Magasanikbacteria bacterium]|nr:hypothetical protein [Candidatus Magasanikbacteria bacterium]